jgi:hypothetical protein
LELEARNPNKTIPGATDSAVIFVGILYTLSAPARLNAQAISAAPAGDLGGAGD